jgi:uncharacterized protein YndB with AHSA1/START domain
MTDSLSLQVERTIPGAIEAVFDAWLDATMVKQFMTPGPGMTVPVATTDARVGGRFHLVMQAGGQQIPHEGEYQIIDRPHKLVFTWVSAPAGNSLVTLDFQKVTESSTKVTLTHEKLATESSRDNHRGGWSAILEALERVMA